VDPLYPLLFVIVVEALGKMISVAVSGGFLSSFLVGHRNANGIDISHLLFADDTLIFCRIDLNHILHLRCLFLCFEAILGLKINLAKLELVPIGNVNNVEVLARIFKCRVSSSPMKYLGLLLGDSFKAKAI
jgi:hypothetical protein